MAVTAHTVTFEAGAKTERAAPLDLEKRCDKLQFQGVMPRRSPFNCKGMQVVLLDHAVTPSHRRRQDTESVGPHKEDSLDRSARMLE